MNTLLTILAVIVLLLVGGCQESESSHEVVEVFPQSPDPVKGEHGTANMSDPIVQKIMQIATDDLAKKLRINKNQIRLSSIESVNWPDSSLGCPQAENSYLQVITPGYKLIFEVNGKIYSYHTDNKERVVLCANPDGENYILPSS